MILEHRDWDGAYGTEQIYLSLDAMLQRIKDGWKDLWEMHDY